MENFITADPEILAHRGFDGEHPENTLRAVREASTDADWLEIDVQQCASGEIVVFHDRDLQGLTGMEGSLRCTPWETLRTLEVLDSGERIPLLEDVFETTPPDVGLMIELKQLGMAERILEIADNYDNRFGLSCSVLIALVEAREVDSEAPVGLQLSGRVYSDTTTLKLGIELAGELDFQFVCHDYRFFLDPANVEYAHERGLAVRPGVLGEEFTEEIWNGLRAAGVDHIVIDAPPEFDLR